ncbi:pentatricopeptide repeat-containing protein At4g21065 [Silene latifolia]|uniref:pentatricopeptide repeat-containing protein At4g21065 n=1 Tax=Silene latifolia TaxID=37657 RepID=UPI003D78081A
MLMLKQFKPKFLKPFSPSFFCTKTLTENTQKPLILKQCIALLQSSASSTYKLKQIHAFSIKHGVPLNHPHFTKHLIFFAVSLSKTMLYAQKVFDQVHAPNIFAWNTMIKGYASSENPRPAISLYSEMKVKNIEVDTHTYPFLLKGISKLLDVVLGEMVHCDVVKNGYDSLVFVQNGLVHFYAVCAKPESAHKVFEEMRVRNLVTWNSVINGFALNGRFDDVLRFYRDMGDEGVKPDGFTIVTLLCACAELGALALGSRVHDYMFKVGLTENLHAMNALLDFYAKCGRVRDAERIFDGMRERSVVSWNSLVVGLAVNGRGNEALEVFKKMEKEGFMPTEITLVGVLYACSHCGMVDEGFDYFNEMTERYGIVPKIEHYGCMVDLLCRAGKVRQAYEFIQNMSLKPNAIIWRTLLGACAIHGDLALAEVSRDKLLELDPKHSGDYVLLSNLYASENRWKDVHQLRATMVKDGVKKPPGFSQVELRNRVHEFVMGDRSHPQDKEIYEMLSEITKLLRLEGYVPHTKNVLADIQEEEKETALSYHSEKIAIAFMLINTLPRTPITVIKNLRVCPDCHVAIKLISKIFDREIVVRDRSRFHHFKDGSCSCKDYW